MRTTHTNAERGVRGAEWAILDADARAGRASRPGEPHLGLVGGDSGSPGRLALPTRAVTLVELLVVISIIGLVMAVSLPAIKGIGQSNVIATGSRQLIDDLSQARQLAINNRSTVHVLFMGPVMTFNPTYAPLNPLSLSTNLLKRQYTSYTIFAERSLGDQPGQAFPRYLTSWRSLPDGLFIAPAKFSMDDPKIPLNGKLYDMRQFQFDNFPYPRGDSSTKIQFFYMIFDPSGRVISRTSPDGQCVIPLARGSIFFEQRPGGGFNWIPAVPLERPRNDWRNNPMLIVIDAATGRARLERPELR